MQKYGKALLGLIDVLDTAWNTILIDSAGLWADRGWNAPPGKQASFEIAYVGQGAIQVKKGGVSCLAQSGEMLFVDIYAGTVGEAGRFKLYYITFHSCCPQTTKKLRECFTVLSQCPQPPNPIPMEQWFLDFIREFQLDQGCRHLFLKHLLSLLLLRFYRDLSQSINVPTANVSTNPSLTEGIIRFLNETYDEAISLEDLADRFGLNKRYLNSLFKNTTGETIMQFLIRLRLDKAKRLLTHTQISITDIALSTGFYDCQHFCRTFKEKAGLTPTQYRLK